MKPNIICSALLILCFFSVSNLGSQYLHHQKLRLKETYSDTGTVQLREKSPLLAGTLSFAVPGLAFGQLYNETYGKYVRHVGISAACIFITYLAVQHDYINVGMGGGSEGGGLLFALFFAYLGNWVWSIMDAVDSASEINKQIKLQKYRSGILNKLKFGLTFDKNKNVNLKFAFGL